MRIIVVIDPGSSLIKVLATGKNGSPQAIALRPEVVRGVTSAQVAAQMAEYGDDPLRSAWLELDGSVWAIGEFAADLPGSQQHHEVSKWENLEARILGILGLVCTNLRQGQPKGFAEPLPVTIGLLMPRSELNPSDRELKLGRITTAARNFCFRGEQVCCHVTFPGIASEGAGLFLAHATALKQQKIDPTQLDIAVVMGGERNTSVLLYRGGKINPSLSFSDSNGFYRFALQVQKLLGSAVPLTDLIQAIALEKTQLRVMGGQIIDLSPHRETLLTLYAQAQQRLLQAKLPPGEVNCIAGGGALHLIWEQLSPWLKSLHIPTTFISEYLDSELQAICSSLKIHPGSRYHLRFADALGLYKNLQAREVSIKPGSTPTL